MSFNYDKCKVMHMGVFSDVEMAYQMGGKQLAVTDEERDLGVIISNDLKAEK